MAGSTDPALDPALDLVSHDTRSDWVRLRTLLVLRWLAILGQTVTIVTASFYLGLRVELGLCFLAIGASVISNLIAMSIFPENQRLSDRDAMLTLLFDLAQLSFLLFLTGGLNNPFALLILAPVTISATALTMRSTTILGALAIVLISMLAYFHVPLTLTTGEVLQLPDLCSSWDSGLRSPSASSSCPPMPGASPQESHSMSQALLATQMALAREQKLTDLGGVVAAAAHELGTPLATIKLVSTELAEELEGQPQLAEDAHADQPAGRPLPRHPALHGDGPGRTTCTCARPRSARLCARRPNPTRTGVWTDRDGLRRRRGRARGATHRLAQTGDHPRAPQSRAERRRLRRGHRIWIDGTWSAMERNPACHYRRWPGVPAGHARAARRSVPAPPVASAGQWRRPGYEGMGLGLFIAKTLLERSGARRSPSSMRRTRSSRAKTWRRRAGARVEVIWPHEAIGLSRGSRRTGRWVKTSPSPSRNVRRGPHGCVPLPGLTIC
jgi:two-component system sensor histidine kinase RegB